MMNKKQLKKKFKSFKKDLQAGEYSWHILAGILTVLLVFVGVRLIGITKSTNQISYQQDQLIEQLETFADIQDLLSLQIEAITSSSQTSLDSLRQQTEDRLADAREAIEVARLNLETQLTTQSQSIRTAINTWRSRIPQIECSFAVDPNNTQEVTLTQGSGTFFNLDGTITMLSNRHVFEEDNQVLVDCRANFPDREQILSFGSDAVSLSEKMSVDFSRVVISNPPEYLYDRVASTSEICTAKADIGENIVILGYPKIGSDKDITATEGIISGYDGDFYITSAKVARGNSGGAAIWVEKNCYLGIPTFATAGQVESLARILDINAI